uniref:Uncharacterized protein n=1 Tax=Knipowitschia caucasica TaxID=637954 RepID=A0AAV2MGP3_KNICA
MQRSTTTVPSAEELRTTTKHRPSHRTPCTRSHARCNRSHAQHIRWSHLPGPSTLNTLKQLCNSTTHHQALHHREEPPSFSSALPHNGIMCPVHSPGQN